MNTKTTVWNWTIRGNRIVEPGTGLYLGGSEGDTPFIAGTVEGNVVVNPVGYCMQIKHQNDYAALPDMPAGPNVTVVRHNIFIKDDRESPDGDRPNLLVGGFPDAGPGSEDRYHIYGNLLLVNPREALLQATGRVSIHDNLFVGGNAGFAALVVTPHQGKSVRSAYVYNNTIYTEGTAIAFAEAASEDDAVVGNLLLAATGMGGPIVDARDNLEAAFADAGDYVAMPSVTLGAMDFYPLPGAVEGSALDLSKMTAEPDYDRDYNGQPKGGRVRGSAYAGAGDDPCGPARATSSTTAAPAAATPAATRAPAAPTPPRTRARRPRIPARARAPRAPPGPRPQRTEAAAVPQGTTPAVAAAATAPGRARSRGGGSRWARVCGAHGRASACARAGASGSSRSASESAAAAASARIAIGVSTQRVQDLGERQRARGAQRRVRRRRRPVAMRPRARPRRARPGRAVGELRLRKAGQRVREQRMLRVVARLQAPARARTRGSRARARRAGPAVPRVFCSTLARRGSSGPSTRSAIASAAS
ncbi:MAG: hypothetical protein U0168_04155 [Nannocystaceae bacterium]